MKYCHSEYADCCLQITQDFTYDKDILSFPGGKKKSEIHWTYLKHLSLP